MNNPGTKAINYLNICKNKKKDQLFFKEFIIYILIIVIKKRINKNPNFISC